MVRVAANPWVGPVVALSPSSIEDWQRCRRLYRSKHLLHLPSLDHRQDLSAGVGMEVHRLLELIHAEDCCGDPIATAALVDREKAGPGRRSPAGTARAAPRPAAGCAGFDAALLRGYLARHAARCPGPGSTWSSHEASLVRYHRRPPRWVLTARIDAVWARDGLLDARDYKTGRRRFERVGDDVVGRLQAWLLAPLAAERGLSLRLSYEHLSLESPGDPDPYEPEDEDLEAIEAEVCAVAAEISSEMNFGGCGNAGTCRRCVYGSICPERTR